jgi:hypothetical protein
LVLNFILTVSSKYVILSAHCIQNKDETKPLDPELSKFIIGKYEFGSNGTLTTVDVKNFIIHPTWNVTHPRYDGDIALAHLKEAVEFSATAQPVCLNIKNNIHGMEGVWTSWTLHVNEITVPIVNHVDCLFSSGEMVKLLAGETAFCAGRKNGEGFCKDF